MSFLPPRGGLSAQPLAALSCTVLDTETTGLDPATDRVLEIAAVRVTPDGVDPQPPWVTLVDPGVPVPASSQAIHGIGDADVRGAPAFAAILDRLVEFVGDEPLLGYSVGFDLAMLRAEWARAGLAWTPPRCLDVRHLVQIAIPELRAPSLEAAAARLGLACEGRHRALSDARLTALVFRALLAPLRTRGVLTLGQAERASLALSQLREDEHRAGWHVVVAGETVTPDDVADYARVDSFPFRRRAVDVMHGPPCIVEPGLAVREALATMIDERISSVFVAARDHGAAGILTERDLLRQLHERGPAVLDAPCGDLASRPLVTVAADEFLYRALSAMAARGFRHLGVTDRDGRLIGALSARDMLHYRSEGPLMLARSIESADAPARLGELWAGLTVVARGLVAERVDAREIAAIVSRELCALTARACDFALEEMIRDGHGPAPAPYAVLVLGSGGRGESLLAMDQDNALVYDATPGSPSVDGWFERFGRRVPDILNDAGVRHCSGGVMMSNAQWRKPLAAWRETVSEWLAGARPEDILGSDIFFDARPVHGDGRLAREMLAAAASQARAARSFQLALARQSADTGSPFRLIGGLRLEEGRLDLKRYGLMPLFTTARVLALRHGFDERSTPARLRAAAALGVPGSAQVDGLLEAHALFVDLVLRQQLRDLDAGIAPSNRIDPAQLAGARRHELRDALSRVRGVADLLGVPLSI